jgi:hypothetical protein
LSDSRRGFGLDIGFTDNLKVVTTNNYNTIADFHTFQITIAHAKSSVVRTCLFHGRNVLNGSTHYINKTKFYCTESQINFASVINVFRSRDSSLATVTGCELNGLGSTPSRGKIFLFSTASRPALGAHPASYSMGTGGYFHGG